MQLLVARPLRDSIALFALHRVSLTNRSEI